MTADEWARTKQRGPRRDIGFRSRPGVGTIGAMSSAVRHVTIDCHDPYKLAGFWADVLGGKIHEDDQPGDAEVLIIGPEPPLLFIQVPEGKTVKNRVHLDIQPQDRTRDAEVERLLERGATMVERPPQGERHGLGHAGRPRGQRVLRRAQPGRTSQLIRAPPRRGRSRATAARRCGPAGAARSSRHGAGRSRAAGLRGAGRRRAGRPNQPPRGSPERVITPSREPRGGGRVCRRRVQPAGWSAGGASNRGGSGRRRV